MKIKYIALIIFLLSPFVSHAEVTYSFLAPLPGVTDSTLVAYLIQAIKFLIAAAGVIGVIRLVICGFKLVLAPGSHQREEAKECLWKIILGLLLALSGFVLLQSINPELTKPKFDPPQTPSVAASATQNQGNQYCTNGVPSQSFSQTAEDSNRRSLCGNTSCTNTSIRINNVMCQDTCQRGCTNVQGLPGNAMSVISTLQIACNCTVTVTGGTEYHLHASHAVGAPIFDLGKTPALNTLIQSGPSSVSFGGFTKYLYNGFYFTNEGNHWHACQQGGGAGPGCN